MLQMFISFLYIIVVAYGLIKSYKHLTKEQLSVERAKFFLEIIAMIVIPVLIFLQVPLLF